jgi:mono/diheme cytochrome c family protein
MRRLHPVDGLFWLALAGWIWGMGAMGCGGAEGPSVPATGGTPIAAEEVVAVYNQKCSLCHGNDGKKMLAGAPDLTLTTLTHPEVVQLIREGKGTMPPHKEVLTPEMIEALAHHVASLKP